MGVDGAMTVLTTQASYEEVEQLIEATENSRRVGFDPVAAGVTARLPERSQGQFRSRDAQQSDRYAVRWKAASPHPVYGQSIQARTEKLFPGGTEARGDTESESKVPQQCLTIY